jgi:branched-subunit amino acid transport protein
MSRAELWIIILGGMLVTFGQRLSFICLLPVSSLPAPVRRSLRFIPPAILSAIVIPELASPGGTLNISLGNERLIAGTIAAIVAWRTRSTWLTIGVGLVAIWLISILR